MTRCRIELALLGSAAIASCAAAHPSGSVETQSQCLTVTIEQVRHNPPEFEGRRICLSGFLGRMIPYGEATPELYSTREDAQSTYSDRRVVLGVTFTVPVQERLSRHSLEPLRVEGIFELESPCVPVAHPLQRDTVCSLPPEMRISHARVRTHKRDSRSG